MRKRVVSLMMALLVMLFFFACGSTAEAAPADPALISQAAGVADLYNEFKADVRSATRKYSNDNITVKGVVTRTGPDIHGTPSIELSDAAGGPLYVLVVVNSFRQLNEVSVGETVTMKGNFHIFSSSDWGVVLKQGEIIGKG